MPRKPPKKSPAKARKSPGPMLISGMKQLRGRTDEFNKENWCGQCGQKLVNGGCGPTHAIKMLEFAKKHLLPTPTDSHTGDEGRLLSAIAKECRDFKRLCPAAIGRAFAGDILKMIETPTAKGGRR